MFLSFYGPTIHQRFETALFVTLSGGNQEGYGFAVAFGAEVNLGGEATSASAQGLYLLRIFRRR